MIANDFLSRFGSKAGRSMLLKTLPNMSSPRRWRSRHRLKKAIHFCHA